MDRQDSLRRLQTDTFDLCIIGGGASGAGCALDAALRGLKVILVEKSDFAAETSSKSTKLIHGGVRYLEQAFKNLDLGQLRQVWHGLEERHRVLANAPHLAHPLALLTPVFSWWEGLYFRIGLWLYDRFASGKDALPASRWLSKAETLRRMPGLSKRIHSAVLYYDGQLDDARYCLALVQSAAEAGAVVVNHAEITGFEKNSQGVITGAYVHDRLAPGRPSRPPGRPRGAPLRARLFLNCTGAHADHIRRLANARLEERIHPSKGVHLVLPAEIMGPSDAALLIPKTPDGRVVFAIPFQGETLLGTTDQDYPTPDREPVLETAEADFLLNTLGPYLKDNVDKRLIKSGFGGLRPLIAAQGKQTKGLVRDHEVEYDPTSNLLSLLGGKWTTYRLMARDAVDAGCRLLGNDTPCTTADHRLAGSEDYAPDTWKVLSKNYSLPGDVARHLVRNYGSQATAVAQRCIEHPDEAQRLAEGYPFIRAEVAHAIRHEMACTPRDVLARRIRLEILNWEATLKAVPVVCNIMAEQLGWSAARKEQVRDEYQSQIRSFINMVNGGNGGNDKI